VGIWAKGWKSFLAGIQVSAGTTMLFQVRFTL